MKTDELREKYLDFYVSKGHTLCESDVLVPTWDKSVLFTPAGMNPFKDHFLGNVELEYTKATSCQKCLRTGDIENVGRTAYHHTFFEMLGNFSFGDYFKREAIHWAWKFLTEKKWLGINPDQLTVTVYLDDDEAAGIWENDIGLTTDRIQRLDEYENFWPAGAPTDGPDGVCGPCSEIFYHPQGIGKGKDVEIWNLVFTQFNRSGDPPDNLSPLPSKNIDTGMGLERIAATLQGVETNFHIDTLKTVVDAAAEITGINYEYESDNGRFLRRISDHIRACTFAIHENVYPGSSKAEYVVRRLLRRCTLEGKQLGHEEPFLYQLVPAVIQSMARPYPELADTSERVQQVIKKEENDFLNQLDTGLVRIEKIFDSMKSGNRTEVNGDEAAELYQTYGIPPELVESIAKDRKCSFDWDGFKAAMDQHSLISGKLATTVMGDSGPIDEIKKESKSTVFLGYETCESESTVVGLATGKQRMQSLDKESQDQQDGSEHVIVLDQTPFYGESGGQVGDTGVIEGPNGKFVVTDVQKNGDIFVHIGSISEGSIAQGDSVQAIVDPDRRDAIRRAHTATHILHYSLQQTLGKHAQQRGSKVTDDWLRFDFSNLEAVSAENLTTIENMTRDLVEQGSAVTAETIPLDEAKSRGAMMLFGEKYPNPVRMVSIGEFSKELCGGIHLTNSAQVGGFEIVTEESASSGTRRIVALTGGKAEALKAATGQAVSQLCKHLNISDSKIIDAFDQLAAQVKELKKRIETGDSRQSAVTSVTGGEAVDYSQQRAIIRTLAGKMNVASSDVAARVESMLAERDKLTAKADSMSTADRIDADGLIGLAETVDGVQVIVHNLPASNPNMMRQLIDQVRKKTNPVALFLATKAGEDKVVLVAGVSNDLVERGIRAGDWVKEIAPIVGGGGGGKPDLAQAGGKLPDKIDEALAAAKEFLTAKATS